MLNTSMTRFHPVDSSNQRLSSSVTAAVEPGMALIQVTEQDPNTGEYFGAVKPSGGDAGELFKGFAYSEFFTPGNAVEVVTDTAAAGGTQLDSVPVGGYTAVRVTLNGVAATMSNSTPGATGTVQLSGSTLIYNSADYGKAVVVTYKHALTVDEARTRYGDAAYGQSASLATGTIGVIEKGTVFTSCFDNTDDYINSGVSPVLKTGANGQVVVGGSGATIPNARIMHVPNSDVPELGIYFSA